MIKAHSAGVGDLLRSSAAWRTLKNKWPNAELHLLFLTKSRGYATEELIRNHHLLTSSHFVTIKSANPHDPSAKNIPFKTVMAETDAIAKKIKPDLIVDFEASGIRTSLVTRSCAKASGARSVGVANFVGRRFFYDNAAPSVHDYVKKHKLSLPMDYTDRDYVVLAALGLERRKQEIELTVQAAGIEALSKLKAEISKRPASTVLMGLNIGCGTPDALHKRPNLELLADALGQIYQETPFTLVLTGADFERDINQAFVATYRQKWSHTDHIIDWAGESSISGLTGIIDAFDFFISTDSGPYHMAVALCKPTLVLFTYPEVTSYHDVPWCSRLIAPYSATELAEQFSRLTANHASTRP